MSYNFLNIYFVLLRIKYDICPHIVQISSSSSAISKSSFQTSSSCKSRVKLSGAKKLSRVPISSVFLVPWLCLALFRCSFYHGRQCMSQNYPCPSQIFPMMLYDQCQWSCHLYNWYIIIFDHVCPDH